MDGEGLTAEVHASMNRLAEAGLDHVQQRDVLLGMVARWAAGEGLPPDRRTAEAHVREFAAFLTLAVEEGVFREPRVGHC